MKGADTIRLPGAERLRRIQTRERNGVPLPAPLLRNLDQLAQDLAIGPLQRDQATSAEGRHQPKAAQRG